MALIQLQKMNLIILYINETNNLINNFFVLREQLLTLTQLYRLILHSLLKVDGIFLKFSPKQFLNVILLLINNNS